LAVSEITKHTCSLSWNPPKYDGGLKITHYIVERKDVNSNHWICISTTCKDTHFIVQGLTEGNEYVFRVIAVNDNGLSAPLEGVNPIKAKSPYGKRIVTRDDDDDDDSFVHLLQINRHRPAFPPSRKSAGTS